jgi:hypothetical protein
MEEVDKLMVEETLVHSIASLSPPQTRVSLPNNKPLIDPKVIEQACQQIMHPNECIKNSKKPIGKRSKRNIDINFNNKRDGRLISRRLHNKSISHSSSISMIEVHESSDSKIDRFLVAKDFYSFEPHLDRPYNFVDNLPPCLKNNPEFPGVKLVNESTISMEDAPVHNQVCSHATVAQSNCEVCLSWIDRYYTNIPAL